jgi:hypothetical protein
MTAEPFPALSVRPAAPPWWERRWVLGLIVLATMMPLLYPQVPPLVDLPGHIGRYRIELDLGHSASLQRFYEFRWAPMGNLGVDLLVLVLAPAIGLEPAVKLIILLIPPLTAGGILWVAREVHGRVPPTAFFALPFIYSFTFLFGFLNFSLSMALAIVAFGLWLRLGRRGRTRLRGWLFVPISFGLFFCHTYGLCVLGLMCFSAETIRLHSRRNGWIRAIAEAAFHSAVLALPLAGMLLWPAAGQGAIASDWFDWPAKWNGVYGLLRDRWGWFDVCSVEIAGVILVFALLSRKIMLSRALALLSAVLLLTFLVLPRFILESAYADTRLLPYLFAFALLAIGLRKPADDRLAHALAALGLVSFTVRLAATTASLTIAAGDQHAKVGALSAIPRGARVATFYLLPQEEPWALPRDSHLGGLVIARREGFSNDQFILGSHNLLRLKRASTSGFAGDPSEIVRPNGAGDSLHRTIDEALAQFPRERFDYVWLLNAQVYDKRLVRGLEPVWRGPESILYRIPHGEPSAR